MHSAIDYRQVLSFERGWQTLCMVSNLAAIAAKEIATIDTFAAPVHQYTHSMTIHTPKFRLV